VLTVITLINFSSDNSGEVERVIGHQLSTIRGKAVALRPFLLPKTLQGRFNVFLFRMLTFYCLLRETGAVELVSYSSAANQKRTTMTISGLRYFLLFLLSS